MNLPAFRYHPDPLATGSIVPSDAVCECCNSARGFRYEGSIYGIADVETLCPWCIAGGLAHERFGVEFNSDVGGTEPYNRASDAAVEEVICRTPGFYSWQQERWLAHCGDACAFLGPAGYPEIVAFDSPELTESIRGDMMMSVEEFPRFLAAFDRDTQPVAFVFQCLHCSILLGYADFT